MTCTCPDFNNGRAFTADNIYAAGQRVASAIARRTYGRRSVARYVKMDSHSADSDGRLLTGYFEATAGRAVDKRGTMSVDGTYHFAVSVA